MRGFLRSNTFKILLTVVLICAGVLILSGTVGGSSLASVFGMVTAPMQQAAAQGETKQYAEMSRKELEELCARLEGENGQLRQQLVDYYDVKQDIRQYQQALNIKEKNLDLELSPASVTGRDPSDLFCGFSIDLGSLDGIQKGDPVITEQGIVGLVTEVYALSAKVTTILSEDIQVGAIAAQLKESGVVSGDAEGATTGLVKLNYLTKESKVQPGTIITSSGAGGVFPKDLIIGKVSFLGSSQTDVSLFAMVEPYEDIRTVSDVFVITNFPGKGQQTALEEDMEASK